MALEKYNVSSTVWQVLGTPLGSWLLALSRLYFKLKGSPLGVKVPSLRPMYYNRNIGQFHHKLSRVWGCSLSFSVTSATQNASVNVVNSISSEGTD